jgi:hypothetical protein
MNRHWRSSCGCGGRNAQILGDNFACAFIHNGIETDFLPLLEFHPPSALDRFDVNIDIKSPVNWLNKTIPFPGVEPFHKSGFHGSSLVERSIAVRQANGNNRCRHSAADIVTNFCSTKAANIIVKPL